MEMGGNFCQILELGGGLLLRDGEYGYTKNAFLNAFFYKASPILMVILLPPLASKSFNGIYLYLTS